MPLTQYQDPMSLGLLSGMSTRTTDRSAAAAQEAIRGHTMRDVAKTEQQGLNRRAALRGQVQLESTRRDGDLQKYLAGLNSTLQRDLQSGQADLQRELHAGTMDMQSEVLARQETAFDNWLKLQRLMMDLKMKANHEMTQGRKEWEDRLTKLLEDLVNGGQKATDADDALKQSVTRAVDQEEQATIEMQAGGDVERARFPTTAWASGDPDYMIQQAGLLPPGHYNLVQKALAGQPIPPDQRSNLHAAAQRYAALLEVIASKADQATKATRHMKGQLSPPPFARRIELWTRTSPLGMLLGLGEGITAEKAKARTRLGAAGGPERLLSGIDKVRLQARRTLARLRGLEVDGTVPPGRASQKIAGEVAGMALNAIRTGQDPRQVLVQDVQDILSGMSLQYPEQTETRALQRLFGLEETNLFPGEGEEMNMFLGEEM